MGSDMRQRSSRSEIEPATPSGINAYVAMPYRVPHDLLSYGWGPCDILKFNLYSHGILSGMNGDP